MRITGYVSAALIAGLALCQPALAQEPSEEEMMAAWQAGMAVGPQHEALAERSGTWGITTTYMMPGSEEMIEEHAVAERTMGLEGRVLEETVQGMMMGFSFQGVGRTGFNNVTGEFWSTWSDTTSTGLIVMHGIYDPDAAAYVYQGTAVDALMGEMTMRIEWTIDSADHETAVFYADLPGQGMSEMMRMVYERQ